MIVGKNVNVKINPNCPGDFEENVDWEFFKSKKKEDLFEINIFVQNNKIFDQKCRRKGKESYKFLILNMDSIK